MVGCGEIDEKGSERVGSSGRREEDQGGEREKRGKSTD